MALLIISLLSFKEKSSINSRDRYDFNYHIEVTSYDEFVKELNNKGVVTDKLQDGSVYVKGFVSKSVNNIIVYSNEDFNYYTGIGKPSYNDLLVLINQNEYICGYFRRWLINYLDSIVRVKPDMDFSVFYHNLKGLKIVKISREDMDKYSENVVARFDAKNDSILYVDSIDEDTFIHEVTHMFSDAYLYLDDKIVHKTLALATICNNNSRLSIKYNYIAFLEGATDIFVSNFYNYNYSNSAYDRFINVNLKYFDLIEEDIFTIFDEGVVYFLDKIISKGISLEDLYAMDSEFNSMLSSKKLRKKV